MTLKGERMDRPTYRILHSLRGGTTGEVYLCFHEVFNAKVVQKTYSTLGREDSIANREPMLLYRMDHDHIVRIYDAQPDPDLGDAITFVTAYCEGGSVLDALMHDFRFSLRHATDVAMQVLSALTYVHSQFRVVHRDGKPGNIYLDAGRRHAYLGDFGSAAEMDEHGSVSSIEGSPLYDPPEGGPSGSRVGIPGDVYQVGLTLFEMLNGRFPYEVLEPKYDLIVQRLRRGLRALPDSAFVFAPHVPHNLQRVVNKAIAREVSNRYQTAADFSRALFDLRPRFIDWTHAQGTGLDGEWTGTWPPHLPPEARRTYTVISRPLRGGRNRRLTALQQLPTAPSGSRFGVDDETLAVGDADGVEAFFVAAAAMAAQRVADR